MTELPIYGSSWPDPGIRFRHVELQINTACDCHCFGCDRFSDVIHDSNMTLDQVRLFVQESVELDWQWERIRLLGGEPTLHPQFREMVELLLEYRGRRRLPPHTFLQVLTNGLGKAEHYRDWLKSVDVSLHAESKEVGVTPAWFNNTRIAPVDRDPDVGELEPCAIFGTYGCGIGLTVGGFFLDGAGASAARVAGLDIGIQHLKDVTWQAMLEQGKVLCRICGHWNDPRPGAPMVTELVSKTGEVTGPYWAEKIAAYKKQRPKITRYGDPAT